jgi:hypothetical protein
MQSNSLDVNRYSNYGGYPSGRLSAASGDINGLYPSNGARYGLGLGGGRLGGIDNKINGLGGPKHKRGDIDRECKLLLADVSQFLFLTLRRLQSIDSQGPVSRICKAIYLHYAKISMDADIYRKN